MAFVPKNMIKLATGAISVFAYNDADAATGQLKATIIAANFFADKRIMGQIKVNDIIFINAKDASTIVKVSAKDIAANTIAVTQFNLT